MSEYDVVLEFNEHFELTISSRVSLYVKEVVLKVTLEQMIGEQYLTT